MSASLYAALEQALVEDPDDLAAHMAYADFLQERGDPRGEFISVQLALEDPARPPRDRVRLEAHEQELLAAHAREWLGDLAPHLLDSPAHAFRLARGWLWRLVVRRDNGGLARAVVLAPQVRLLRELIVEEDPRLREQRGSADWPSPSTALCPTDLLARSPWLGNVRVLQVGEQPERDDFRCFSGYAYSPGLPALVARLPRVEELHLFTKRYDPVPVFAQALPRLRVLQVYHLADRYPLEVLAANPSLGRLTHLLCHPHYHAEYDEDDPFNPDDAYINLAGLRAVVHSPHLTSLTHLQLRLSSAGDAGCAEIVASGILKRLKVLDLRHGGVTDDGARVLAADPDLKNLERFDLSRNRLTREGEAALLRVLGTALRADDQIGPDGNPNQYLFEGDFE
jgi:uncharacterized protein (TIGR02996 family)